MSDDCKVGYGKPPRHSRFRKGESGNPRGRPKKEWSLRDRIAQVLDEKVTVTEGGQTRLVTKRDAMVKSLVAKALNGDLKAVQLLIALAGMGSAGKSTTDDDDDKLDPIEAVEAAINARLARIASHQRLRRTQGEESEMREQPEEAD